MSCDLVPEGDRSRRCYHHPSAMQLSPRYLPRLLGKTRAPLASVYRCNPLQNVPCNTCTAFHLTQDTDLHVTLRYGRGVGFMGGSIDCYTVNDFWNNLLVPYSGVKQSKKISWEDLFNHLALEDGTDRLSRNVGN